MAAVDPRNRSYQQRQKATRPLETTGKYANICQYTSVARKNNLSPKQQKHMWLEKARVQAEARVPKEYY